ncbi:hypothetical protein HPB48_015283 [Haemaphysalis longicornis]|uniref:DDE-1 domain-containing protein n=1 Tax=Haemaphysalis longicornis TaxID=44386 RepID=A0A9J6GVX4_HAELO|nr:hypothetical protein HPB48_015283 [Haemaphysalis longicornis]
MTDQGQVAEDSRLAPTFPKNQGVALRAADISDVNGAPPSHPLHALQWQDKPGRRGVTLAFSWITARPTKPPASSTTSSSSVCLRTQQPGCSRSTLTKSFKVGYRRRLLDRLFMNLRVGTELKVDQLGAIHMITGAWNSVKQSVANCFRKAGFVTAEHSEACEDGDDDE